MKPLRDWPMPVVAIVVGVCVLSLAAVDYATSPSNHRGIHLGPLFLPLPPNSEGGTASHRPPPPPGVPSPSSGLPGPVIGPNGLKAPIMGLLDRQKAPTPAFYGVMSG